MSLLKLPLPKLAVLKLSKNNKVLAEAGPTRVNAAMAAMVGILYFIFLLGLGVNV